MYIKEMPGFKAWVEEDKTKTRKSWKSTDQDEYYSILDKTVQVELNKRIDKTIKYVIGQRNDIEVTRLFLNEINAAPKNVPIIAHNGESFDFPNYNQFILRLASTLKVNLYYQLIRENDPKAIRERMEYASVGDAVTRGDSARLIAANRKEITRVNQKIKKGLPLNTADLTAIGKFNNEIENILIEDTIKNVESRLGIVTNQGAKLRLFTGEKSQLNLLKGLVLNYINEKDPAKRLDIRNAIFVYFNEGWMLRHNVRQDAKILEYTDKLLKETEEGYTASIQQAEAGVIDDPKLISTRKLITDAIKEELNIADDKVSDFNYNEANTSIELQIQQVTRFIAFIETSGRKSHKEKLTELATEQAETLRQYKEVEKTIADLTKNVENGAIKQESLFDVLRKASKKLQDITKNVTYRVNRVLKEKLNEDKYGYSSTNITNYSLLKIELDNLQLELNNSVQALEKLISIIEESPNGKIDIESPAVKDLLAKFIDPEIVAVKNVEEKNKVLNAYNKRSQELSNMITVLNNGKVAASSEFDKKIEDIINKKAEELKALAINKLKELVDTWNNIGPEVLGKDFRKIPELKLDEPNLINILNTFFNILKLKENTNIIQDKRFANLVDLFSKNKGITKLLSLLKEKENLAGKLDTLNLRTLVALVIKDELNYVNNNIDLLNRLKFDRKQTDLETNTEAVTNKFIEILSRVKKLDDIKKEMEYDHIYTILNGGKVNIENISKEERLDSLENLANQKEGLEFIQQLNIPNVTRVYKDVHEGVDRKALVIKEDIALIRRPTENFFIVNFFDNYNGVVNSYKFSLKGGRVSFEFNYSYIEAGKTLEVKTITLQGPKEDEDVNDWLKRFFNYKDAKGQVKLGHTKLPQNIVYLEDGVDHSFESIKRTLTHYEKYRKLGLFELNDEGIRGGKVLTEKFLKEEVIDDNIPDSALEIINMTQVLKNRFFRFLNIHNYARKKETIKNTKLIYEGMADRTLSRFVSNDPSKYLLAIPSTFSANMVINWTVDGAEKLNVDLDKSAEGSSGKSNPILLPTNVDMPHTLNTNPSRIILPYNKQYLEYTPYGLINNIYSFEDKLNRSVKFEELLELYFEQAIKDNAATGDLLTELLERKTDDGKLINTFTPNQLTEKQFEYYKRNIFHKIGMNLEIGFMDMPAAYEDALIIDRKVAKIIGANEGWKIWLGMWGFKGAIRFEDGIREKFGVSIIANKSSVQQRGAGGAILEQTLNGIRKYLVNPELQKRAKELLDNPSKTSATLNKAFIKKYGLTERALRVLASKDKELKDLFTIKEGKIILDPGENYYDVLLNLFGEDSVNKVKVFSDLTYDVITEDITIERITDKGDVVIDSFKGLDIQRGEIYVIADADHTAEKMSVNAKLNSNPELAIFNRDIKGNVEGGVPVTPSFVAILAMKGVDFKVLLEQDFRKEITIYSEIQSYGIEKFLEGYAIKLGDGKYDIKKTVDNIKARSETPLIDEAQQYMMFFNMRIESNTKDKSWFDIKLSEINLASRNRAQEFLTSNTGAIYTYLYRKHPGVRQQLLANIDLSLGNLRTSKDSWETLSKKKDWLQLERLDETTWLKLINAFAKGNNITSIKGLNYEVTLKDEQELKDFIIHLNKQGITNDDINGNGNVLYTVGKNNTVSFARNNLGRKFGWVLTARWPIQDANSTPTLKIIGYHDHAAIEANPYMYKMMGADNDGDTIGMIGLSQQQFIDGRFDRDDATKESYYDEGYWAWDPIKKQRKYVKGYLEKIREELKPSVKTNKRIQNINYEYTSVGKSVFERVRSTYKWSELYGSLYEGIQKDIDSLVIPETLESSVNVVPTKNKALPNVTLNSPRKNLTGNQIKYLAKDQVKANKANKFIGRGSEASSTNQYVKDFKDQANTGNYVASDIVFVSAEGARENRIAPNFDEINKAIKAGVTFITDDLENRSREYNIGEREVAAYLEKNNYIEAEPGSWIPKVKEIRPVLDWNETEQKEFLNVAIRKIYNLNTAPDFELKDYDDPAAVKKALENKTYFNIAARSYLFQKLVDSNKYDLTQYVGRKDFKIINNEVFEKHLSEKDKNYIIKIGVDNIIKNRKEKANADLIRKIFFRKLYAIGRNETVTRFQGSKVGINIFGGVRKIQTSKSTLSIFTNINRDQTGNVWNSFKASSRNIVSVDSLASTFEKVLGQFRYTIYSTALKDQESGLNFENLKAKINRDAINFAKQMLPNLTDEVYNDWFKAVAYNPETKIYIDAEDAAKHKDYFKQDAEEVLIFLYKKLYAAALVVKELNSFAEMMSGPNKVDAVVRHFDTFYKDATSLNPFYVELIKKYKGYQKNGVIVDKFDKVDEQYLYLFYFSRNEDAIREFKKAINPKAKKKNEENLENVIKRHASTYLNQSIVDRGTLNIQSIEANNIIGIAKHGPIRMMVGEYLRAFKKRVLASANKVGIRDITIGVDDDHDNAIAVGMDKDTFEQEELKIEDNNLKALKDRRVEIKSTQLQGSYKSQASAQNAVNLLINEYAKKEMFGDIYVPDAVYNLYKNIVVAISKAFNEERNLEKALDKTITVNGEQDTVNNFLGRLVALKIPGYRFLRIFNMAYGTFQEVESRYAITSDSNAKLDIKEIPLLSDGYYFYKTIIESMGYKQRIYIRELLPAKYQHAKDFLLGSKEVDVEFVTIGEEGQTSQRINTVKNSTSTRATKDNLHIVASKLSNPYGNDYNEALASIKKAGDLESESVTQFLKDENLDVLKDPITVEELVNKITETFKEFKSLKAEKEKAYNNRSKETAKDSLIRIVNNELAFYKIENLVKEIRTAQISLKENNDELYINKQKLKQLAGKLITLKEQEEDIVLAIDQIEKLDLNDSLKYFKKRLEDLLEKKKQIQMGALGKVFARTFTNGIFLLHTPEGETTETIKDGVPRYFGDTPTLTSTDIDRIKRSNLMNMDKYIFPLITVASIFKKDIVVIDGNGNKTTKRVYDVKALYEYLKSNRGFIRLVVQKDAYDMEGLAKQVGDLFVKDDPTWENKSRWDKFWGRRKHAKDIKFKSFEDIIEYINKLNDPIKYAKDFEEAPKKILFKGKEYTSVDLDGINLGDNLSPTLKEIDLRSWKELDRLLKLLEKKLSQGESLNIGIVTIDTLMTSYETAYKPFKFSGSLASFLGQLQYLEKLLMRFNYGFIMRNYIDTWLQLYSEIYKDFDIYGSLKNNKEIVRIMGLTQDVYNMYQDISEERILTLLEVKSSYDKLNKLLLNKTAITKEQVLEVIKHFLTIRYKVNGYVEGAQSLKEDEIKNRIKYRLENQALVYQKELNNLLKYLLEDVVGVKSIEDLSKVEKDATFNLKNKDAILAIANRSDIRDSVNFLLDIRFAEYFTLYDNLKFGEDKGNVYRARIEKRIKKYEKYKDLDGTPIYNADYKDLKNILFEISAFMQTNAQIDTYRQESFAYLRDLVSQRVALDANDFSTRSFKEVYNEIEQQRNGVFSKGILKLVHSGYKNLFEDLNTNTENVGRIAGYLLDRQLRGYTFQESVNSSLKRFFNYGLRSPLEMQLLADIPYLSFPVRSIRNWIDRISDPRIVVLLSDVIDGVYGQYADEDGQYSDFELLEMQSGWLRISNNIGIRIGFGLFDVQNILSDPSQALVGRQRPLLKGISKFLETRNVMESIRQLAIAGPITRVLNALPIREDLQQSVLKPFVSKQVYNPATIVPLVYTVQNYEKFTPRRYRYGRNGRWAKYENIYKDWFNKFGRMRKPTVNPYRLVKNIQWRQYVRYRQSQAMILK